MDAHPDAIGRFRIESVLGRGAMGVTYRAIDQVLHRQVALKVVNVPADALNLPAVRERFLREARAAAATPPPA